MRSLLDYPPTPVAVRARGDRRAGAGAAGVSGSPWVKPPEDVTNENAEFQDTGDQPTPPPEKEKRKKRDTRDFVWPDFG